MTLDYVKSKLGEGSFLKKEAPDPKKLEQFLLFQDELDDLMERYESLDSNAMGKLLILRGSEAMLKKNDFRVFRNWAYGFIKEVLFFRHKIEEEII